MSGSTLNREAVEARITKAENEGFEVIQTSPKTLLLDLDTPEAESTFEERISAVEEYCTIHYYETWNSKSGNKHVQVFLYNDLDPVARYALQLFIGSDPTKEYLFIVANSHFNNPDCSLLFRPKGAKVTKVYI